MQYAVCSMQCEQYCQYLHNVDVLHGVEGHGPEDVSDVDDILVVEPGIDT